MRNIKIIGRGKYIPKYKVNNKYFSERFNVTEEYIYNVCGIENRYYEKSKSIDDMAYEASKDAILNAKIEKEEIDLIIVASCSSNKIMPGISYLLQKRLDINNCMCLDVLGGCSGYINAFDIARNYIAIGKVNNALIVGVDKLSSIVDENDLSTSILLGDGAGATIISNVEDKKIYVSNFKSEGQKSNLLTFETDKKLKMEGIKIYKYAVTDVPKIINDTLKCANLKIEDINCIFLHQSNKRIIDSIVSKLKNPNTNIYMNIKNIGNTFCASIPIALSDAILEENDKIMLVGYGGGLNTACILLEF